MRVALALLPLCVLAACGPAENDPGPGGVTVGEAEALDEAAEMLDARKADFGEGAQPASGAEAGMAPEEQGGPEPAEVPEG